MVKEVEDYVAIVQERYPFLSKAEINKILTYGLKMYAWVNKMHADVLICYRKDDPMTIHCGPLGCDNLKHYYRFITKQRMRQRVLFRLKNLKWDGYYYLGLKEDEHQAIMKQGKRKTFINVYPTKLRAELDHIPFVKHIWRIPMIDDLGWKFHRDKLVTEHAKYLGKSQYEKYHQCFLKRDGEGHASADDQSTVLH